MFGLKFGIPVLISLTMHYIMLNIVLERELSRGNFEPIPMFDFGNMYHRDWPYIKKLRSSQLAVHVLHRF